MGRTGSKRATPTPPEPDPKLLEGLAEAKPLLRSLARRLTKNTADADDLVQDVMERALLKGGDVGPDKLRSWLITVLNHLFIDQCRKRARRPKPVGVADIQAIAAPPLPEAPNAWERLNIEALRAAVARLPDDFRVVYEMHAFERKSYQEISEALGVPKATVGTRLMRSRKRLKDLLLDTLEKGPS